MDSPSYSNWPSKRFKSKSCSAVKTLQGFLYVCEKFIFCYYEKNENGFFGFH